MKVRIIRRRLLVLVFVIAGFYFAQPANSTDYASITGASYPGEKLEKMSEVDAEQGDIRLKSMNAIEQAQLITLSGLDTEAVNAIIADDSPRKIIGVPRTIGALQSRSDFQWDEVAGGGFSSTSIFTSSGAAALRIGITVNSLPNSSELRFFRKDAVDNNAEVIVTGKEINKLIQMNKTSDPDNKDADVYWSPVIEGENLGVEIYLPYGVDPVEVQIAFQTLSHLAISPFSLSERELIYQSYGDSNACQNDATCYTSWLNMRNSVAKMIYTDSGSSYTCTGTLLNDVDSTTWKPYFISANHCIASQTVASTLQTLWFFESSSCNGTTRNANYTTRSGGATLLWTGGMTTSNLDSSQDLSFFKLLDTPPAGVHYAGWNASIDPGELTGIHHPQGDWKKNSFGDQAGDYTCYSTGGGGMACSSSSSGSFLRLDWTDGGTEPGSSGSGIFNNSDQLLGVLSGGNGVCEGSSSYYSKFSVAYSAGNLGQWLNVVPPSEDAYEENDTQATAYDLSSYEGVWLSSIAGDGIQKDNDWYKINIPAGSSRLLVDLRFTDADGDIDLALVDSSGAIVSSSISLSDNEYISFAPPASGGEYWLRVYLENAGNSYDLRWNAVQGNGVTMVPVLMLLLNN